jgi:large subunit ribosomal protein L15
MAASCGCHGDRHSGVASATVMCCLELFEADSPVTPEILAEQGLITKVESQGLVKILGDGEIERALTVRAHKFSASARQKIEDAGGSIELIPMKVTEKTKRRKDENGKRVPPPTYS